MQVGEQSAEPLRAIEDDASGDGQRPVPDGGTPQFGAGVLEPAEARKERPYGTDASGGAQVELSAAPAWTRRGTPGDPDADRSDGTVVPNTPFSEFDVAIVSCAAPEIEPVLVATENCTPWWLAGAALRSTLLTTSTAWNAGADARMGDKDVAETLLGTGRYSAQRTGNDRVR